MYNPAGENNDRSIVWSGDADFSRCAVRVWYGVAGPTGALGRAWDVDPKNDRFLMITLPTADTAGGPAAQPEIDVVLNWIEELKQRVPKH